MRYRELWAAVVCLFVVGAARGVEGPPVAAVRPVVDVYHGDKITDPYRWLEKMDDPAVRQWVRGQADYAAKVLAGIPGRDALLARIVELDAGAPYRLHVVQRWANGDLLYLKAKAEENIEKLYLRDGKTGAERLLVDPEKFEAGTVAGPRGGGGAGAPPPQGTPAHAGHVSLEFCVGSPGGRYVAYGVAAAGSEETVLHVFDVRAGVDLPDTIDRMEADYTPPHWLADESGFVDSRRRKLAAGAPPTEVYKRTASYLHKLGQDPEKDAVIFAMDRAPGAELAEADFPSVVLTEGSGWAIGKVKHGDAAEMSLYAAPAAALAAGQSVRWVKICDRSEGVEAFAVHGDSIDLVTSWDAPRYKVVRLDLRAPAMAQGKAVFPAGERVVKGVAAAKDGIYVNCLNAGRGEVWRVPYSDDKPRQIALPEGAGSGYAMLATPAAEGAFVATESWTRAGRLYAYDPAADKLADTGLRPRGKFDDPEGLEAEEVMVTSHDGVQVPLSIIHRAGLKLDGSHPTLITGYGAYGMVQHVGFSPTRLAWLERGGVLAIAHVRGGGEFGRDWHRAGQMAKKPNTWKDFIACGQYLVDKGYTSKAKLAGSGGSAGGILIGRAITERPDLFAAAIIQVGCTDMLRMETTTNGVPNIQEFGSTATVPGFESCLEMSAYHHVEQGTKYPAVLLTHGINDPRVEPWMSFKMAARLQAATASGRPVLLRVDYDAGHGIGSTKRQRQESQADQWAFLLWQMGEMK